jgi:hypothetical protein
MSILRPSGKAVTLVLSVAWKRGTVDSESVSFVEKGKRRKQRRAVVDQSSASSVNRREAAVGPLEVKLVEDGESQ